MKQNNKLVRECVSCKCSVLVKDKENKPLEKFYCSKCKKLMWNCFYCKNSFNSLLDRDNHHRTHPEHYRKMFEYLLFISNNLDKEISTLRCERDALKGSNEDLRRLITKTNAEIVADEKKKMIEEVK